MHTDIKKKQYNKKQMPEVIKLSFVIRPMGDILLTNSTWNIQNQLS